MKTAFEMAREAGLLIDSSDRMSTSRTTAFHVESCYFDIERFAALVRADEREALETLYTDANYIFNNPPGEASQEVRDVIEWYAASIQARGETK